LTIEIVQSFAIETRDFKTNKMNKAELEREREREREMV
jgi:hypothetical protein